MKHSINSLITREEAELALLRELYKLGGEGDTSDIINRAIAHFPALQTQRELNRETPSGRLWWPGRFRYYLSDLGKKDEVQNIKRGIWRITRKGIDRLKKAGYIVKKSLRTDYSPEEEQIMPELTLTEKLMDVWATRTEGSKAEICQQISERIFGLLSLAALTETKPMFDQLWELIDFNELYRMTGSMGVTGFWGKDTFLEPF